MIDISSWHSSLPAKCVANCDRKVGIPIGHMKHMLFDIGTYHLLFVPPSSVQIPRETVSPFLLLFPLVRLAETWHWIYLAMKVFSASFVLVFVFAGVQLVPFCFSHKAMDVKQYLFQNAMYFTLHVKLTCICCCGLSNSHFYSLWNDWKMQAIFTCRSAFLFPNRYLENQLNGVRNQAQCYFPSSKWPFFGNVVKHFNHIDLSAFLSTPSLLGL